ncbi:MAG: CBS domain-containing protein [Candidatus Nitrosocaldus sp.]
MSYPSEEREGYEYEDVESLLNKPVEYVLTTNVVTLEGNMNAADAASIMKERGSRSVLVTHNGEAIGIVTKTDILFKVMAQGKNPNKVRLREIMSSPIITISPKTSISDALAVMEKHVLRQVIVSSGSTVIGMVTREGLFEKIHKASMMTSQTALKGTPVCIINPKAIAYVKEAIEAKLSCPYCGSPFDDKNALSKHIDRLHIGSGVLEGDVRRIVE